MEGVLWHGGHHSLFYGSQLLQNGSKRRTDMGILLPAFYEQKNMLELLQVITMTTRFN